VRRRVLGLITLAFLLGPLLPAQAGVSGAVDESGDTLVVTGDVYAAAGGSASPGYEYAVGPVGCTWFFEDPNDPLHCAGAPGCPGAPPDDELNKWRYATVERRLTGSDDPWLPVASGCLNFAAISPQVTPEMAREQFLQLLPVLEFGIQPAANSVVNLPVIVYTDATREFGFPPVDIIGQSVLIRTTATTYEWDFGGAHLTTNWPGRAFANDCNRVPCDGYVSYPFPGPGIFDIGLTVTWVGEFSVSGGAWQEIPGVGTTSSPAQPVTVLEANAVLTDPYD